MGENAEGSGESTPAAAAPAAPVFGSAFTSSGFTFGVPAGGAGFGGAGVATKFTSFGAKVAEEDEEDASGDPEAECTATFKPLVSAGRSALQAAAWWEREL